MNLHTTGQKPDWDYARDEDLTRWQSIALATHGVITPGNLISISGLLVVIYGSIELYNSQIMFGLIFLLVGRVMDLVDGFVAEYTKTKSQLGEIVDTSCDKISLIFAVIAAYGGGLVSGPLILILFLHHTFTALYSILYARRYRIHTRRFGKYAMFASWVAILLAIYAATNGNRIIDYTSGGITFVYAALAIVAIIDYYQELQRKIVDRMRAANWSRKVRSIIYVYNRKASNYKRAERWITRITKIIRQPQIDVSVSKMDKQLVPEIRKTLKQKHAAIVAVAGGDGTVSSVANILLREFSQAELKTIYFIPLWGGNANDVSVMLNGLHTQTTPQRVMSQSEPVAIPTIDVSIKKGSKKQHIFACGYASFGASAYAARRINQKRISNNRFIKYFPLVFIVRELHAVMSALGEAPRFRSQIGNKEQSLYENTFINGSRMAKVNRVPISLDEPAFFHAAVDRKHPSYIIEFIKIILKRTRKQYVKRQAVTFTLHDDVNAQIDGEVHALESGTHISIKSSVKKLYCISTKLDASS